MRRSDAPTWTDGTENQGEVEERSSKLESEWADMEFGRTRSKFRTCERLPERI